MEIYLKSLSDICQGDIFLPSEKEISSSFSIKADIPLQGFIVISNTCDIKNNIDYICVSPIVPLKFMVNSIVEAKRKKGIPEPEIKKSISKNIDNLSKYNKKEYFYLPKCKKLGINEESVVLLKIIKSCNFNDVCSLISNNKKCSLKSPWREKLGWAVGNLYNRISLIDYPQKIIKKIIKKHSGSLTS